MKKAALRDATLFVIRLRNKSNEYYENIDYNNCDLSDIFLNSKPCCKCDPMIKKCIHKYGLKRVYYSS